jgi:DNA-binding NtrC family response regulator
MTTILIADNDKEFVDILSRGLRRQRYTVLTASNKHEAITHLEAQAVDVVFLDAMMPDKEGLKTLIEIKQRFPHTPVYMTSGGTVRENFDSLVLAMDSGATSGLRKPIDIAQVIAIVRSLPLKH